MPDTRATFPTQPRESTWSPIIELRQYTLHPGRRDELIAIFDSHLIDGQEALGMRIIGQFRDIDAPQRFVWLRGFSDMATRAESLRAFYGGPVWQQHRIAANDTMVDSSDVLLLRPSHLGSGFQLTECQRPPLGEATGAGLVVASIYSLTDTLADEARQEFEREITQAITTAGGSPLAYLVTEPARNTFPALPVRENETVLVWFAGFPHREDLAAFSDDSAVRRFLGLGNLQSLQVLRLAATSRSILTATSPECRLGDLNEPA